MRYLFIISVLSLWGMVAYSQNDESQLRKVIEEYNALTKQGASAEELEALEKVFQDMMKKKAEGLEQETEKQLNETLSRFSKVTKEGGNVSQEELTSLAEELDSLTRNIDTIISRVDGTQALPPSAERLVTIKKWGKMIQPYNEELARTALQYNREEPYNKFINETRNLLDFTFPDKSLVQVTREILGDQKSNLHQGRKAVRLLLEHRVIIEEDKIKLLEKGSHLSGRSKLKWMATLSELGISGDVEVLVNYLNGLDFEGVGEDQHISYLGPVFSLMGNLGEEADRLKEPLQRIQKIFETEAPNYVGNIQRVIDWVDNGHQKEKLRARNSSGYLDELVDWEAVGTVQNKQRLKLSDEQQRSFKTNKKESDSGLAKQDSLEPEESPSRLPWIIAGVLLLGILLLLFKIFKGKSTS